MTRRRSKTRNPRRTAAVVRVHNVPSSPDVGPSAHIPGDIGAFVPANVAKAIQDGRLDERRRKRNIRSSAGIAPGGGIGRGPVSSPSAGGSPGVAPRPGGAGGGGMPGGGGGGRRPGRWDHRRRHRYWPWWNYYGPGYLNVVQPLYYYYPWGDQRVDGLPLPDECVSPLGPNCEKLTLTKRWAIVCFMPLYSRMRAQVGTDPAQVVTAMLRSVSPHCLDDMSEATLELRRRFALAVSILMRGEGYPIAMVEVPPSTDADRQNFKQGWMRALMTGTL